MRLPFAAAFTAAILCHALPAAARPARPPSPERFDVAVYGGTAAGAIAAVQAKQMGRSVVLVEPGRRLGGLTTGGLGNTDIGNKAAIGGLARTFYERIAAHYARPGAWVRQTRAEYERTTIGNQGHGRPDAVAERNGRPTMWVFEPGVAERILRALVEEAGVPVRYAQRLDRGPGGLAKRGAAIESIRMETGERYEARVFIDATYEADLMAKAGVSYAVGREANATYGETLNGVQTAHATSHQFRVRVDPYVVAGDPSSGLLPGVHDGGPGEDGSGDRRVQAYNFRLTLTDAPVNRLPIPRPEGYDPRRYELLRRYVEAGVFDAIDLNGPMPNRKTDVNNNGAFSSDHVGGSDEWPDGDYATRERIFRDHASYVQGLWYFLQNDPRLPAALRETASRWGLCRDEFAASGHWPPQLYVREARRMLGEVVTTEHHCRGASTAVDSIGLAAYGMDSHNVQRYVADGAARNEGDVQGGEPLPRLLPRDHAAAGGGHEPARARGALGEPHRVRLDPHGAGVHDPRAVGGDRGLARDRGQRRRAGRAVRGAARAARARRPGPGVGEAVAGRDGSCVPGAAPSGRCRDSAWAEFGGWCIRSSDGTAWRARLPS